MRRSKSAGGWLGVGVLMVLISAATASPARAQGSTDPNPGALTLTGGFDFANAYFFRGIFQDGTGVVMALRRSRLRAALRRWCPQEREREYRDVEQSPHR